MSVAVVVDAASTEGPLPRLERQHAGIQRVKGPGDQAKLAALGVDTERWFHRPSVFSKGLGVYDWVSVARFNLQDPTIDELNSRGVTPVVATEGIPGWLLPAGVNPDHPNTPPTDWTKYTQVLADGFVHVRERCPQVRIVESYNEPDLVANGFSEATRFRFFDAFVAAVRQANTRLALTGDDQLRVGGPVYRTCDLAAIGRFLDHVNAAGAADVFGSIIWHEYNVGRSRPAQYRSDVEAVAALGRSKGLERPTLITEWGLSTVVDKNPTPWTLSQNAAAVAAVLRQLIDAAIDGAFVFAQSDYTSFVRSFLAPMPIGADPTLDARDGVVFPSYNVGAMLARLPATRVALNDGLDSGGLGVGALAAVDDAALGVVLWNYLGTTNSATTAATVSVMNAWPGVPLTVECYVTDTTRGNWAANHNAADLVRLADVTLDGSTRTIPVSLSPNAVMLLLARPQADEGQRLWQAVLDATSAYDAYVKGP